MGILITLAIFFFILTLLVLVHEIGHFATARLFKIRAEEFGIGLPPRIFGIKKGETLFSLNWIPLGGFVKIKGEQGEDAGDTDSFAGRPVWQRAIVLSAGVIMNVILAAIFLSIGFLIGTPQIVDEKISPRAHIEDHKIQVASVLPESPASKTSISRGDVLVSIDSTQVLNVREIQEYISEKSGEEVRIEFLHDGEVLQKTIVPSLHNETGRTILGLELIPTGVVSYPFWLAIPLGIKETGLLLKEIIFAFGNVIGDLMSNERVSVDLSGPVGIAVITAEVAKLGIPYLIQFTALLSLNLAIINFVPFPALDGGRFLFLMIEKVKGSALNQRVETASHTVGFALLIILVLIVTYRDIQKYQDVFSNFWSSLTGYFL